MTVSLQRRAEGHRAPNPLLPTCDYGMAREASGALATRMLGVLERRRRFHTDSAEWSQ